ncbi:glycosyl hydrolase [Bifidobacterium sp. ESL0690]|uniref:glycoside hydrolase 5 family protein n=1 Tax=Bifidobacterium sp. ESL0690 TaxID=2983214 RepID=UPI0023FA2BE5|nr:glycosyl hydrolase [Bifidobacterium sp. ESL0690]WEV46202.1 glycosyl hydrolase [Bifidobacterium sp. ESL0690]
MRFGVNYTPSSGWFYTWLKPDWDSIRRDLDAIKGLGVDHVRLFPLWPVLQPNRTWINEDGLADVRHMAMLASERELDVYSDVLQGHLSSFDFVPSWLVSWHEGSMFTDDNAVAAEAKLVSALYDALADIPHFKGLNIGNECNQFADATHPRRMAADEHGVQAWLEALMAPVHQKAHANGHVLMHSENDAIWYEDGHPFTSRQACNIGDISIIHSWVFNGTAQHYGPLSAQSLRHAEYLAELSKAFADDPGRQVWLQEIGAPQNVIDEADTPEFCRKTVEHVLDCENLYGITWWCSHDVNRGMKDFPVFEHDLGLFDEQGELKPIGKAFAGLARQYRDMPEPAARRQAIVVKVGQDGNAVLKSACAPGGSVFERWMEMSEAGQRPALVSSAQAVDRDFCKARGIEECIEVPMTPGLQYNAVSDPSLESKKQ